MQTIVYKSATGGDGVSKEYVDEHLALKVDKTSGTGKLYGTDSSGSQTTYNVSDFLKADNSNIVSLGDL